MAPIRSSESDVTHLVLLYVVTSGNNTPTELGSDEHPAIKINFSIFDVKNRKNVASSSEIILPRIDLPPISDIQTNDREGNSNFVTDLCFEQTGLSNATISKGKPAKEALQAMDHFLLNKGISLSLNNWCFICDGQAPLRLILHPESHRAGYAPLPSHFYRFYDLRKEFRKFYKVPTDQITCIQGMLDHASISDSNKANLSYGEIQVSQMESIVSNLLSKGHIFGCPELIKPHFEPGICAKNEYVDDETVVRARGLPWQSSDQDIGRFFAGLNVSKGGVALCLSPAGRRNGEALIRFDCREHRDLALRRHKHHLGTRYIEVYRASGRDFVGVAGGCSADAQQFLSLGGHAILRMRGLPYTATAEQVIEFFAKPSVNCGSLQVMGGKAGVLFVRGADGRATGDAFVMLATEQEGSEALNKHRELIGTRYIELFKSTTAEVQQVLNRYQEQRLAELQQLNQLMLAAACQLPTLTTSMFSPITNGILPVATLPTGLLQPNFLPTTNSSMPPIVNGNINQPTTNLTTFASGVKSSIRLKNLPQEVSVNDILTFLGEHSKNIIFQGVHLVYDSYGQPAGEAYVQMETDLAAESATLTRNNKYMLLNGQKYFIDVVQCSGNDIQKNLSTTTLSVLQNQTNENTLPVGMIPITAATAIPPGGGSLPVSNALTHPSIVETQHINNIFPYSTISTIPTGSSGECPPTKMFCPATSALAPASDSINLQIATNILPSVSNYTISGTPYDIYDVSGSATANTGLFPMVPSNSSQIPVVNASVAGNVSLVSNLSQSGTYQPYANPTNNNNNNLGLLVTQSSLQSTGIPINGNQGLISQQQLTNSSMRPQMEQFRVGTNQPPGNNLNATIYTQHQASNIGLNNLTPAGQNSQPLVYYYPTSQINSQTFPAMGIQSVQEANTHHTIIPTVN